MKKLLSILLCILMLLSISAMVACSNDDGDDDDLATLAGKTSVQLYEDAQNKLKGLQRYEMLSTQVITMNYAGTEIVMNQTITSKQDGQDLYVKMYNDTSTANNMECWYVDEWFYVIQGSVKGKAQIDYEDYVNTYMPEGSTSSDALMNIPSDWFKGVEFVQDKDNYYLEFVVSGDEFQQYMASSTLNSYIESAEIDDIVYKVYFTESGELGDIVVEMDMVIEGVSAHARSVSRISNLSASIVAPEGNFIDVTGQI